MKSLSLSLLGLVLISVPGCLSKNKQCFSLKLKPSYPCCTGDKVVLTDENGNWGIENNEWCGIGESTDTCFSVALGYPCCKNNNKVVYTDESGDWGVEDGKWCGIDNSDSCFATDFGYPCCESCKAVYSDERGDWGKENSKWCGLKKKCASSHDDTETETETETENENEIDNDFELSFMKLENEKKNMLYSPLSIKYALSMLKEGAGGNTYSEINNLIGNKKLPKYTNVNETLSLANGLFVRDIYYKYVNPEYINVLERKYEAEVIEDEFKSAYNANKWIEDKTLGIIKNMLNDEIVTDENTEMLIINALAIDMELVDKFYPEDTTGLTFYLDDGTDMKATTMRMYGERNNDISFYKDENLTVLSMNLKSYEGTQLEFIAVMPKENLSAYIKNVTKEQINKIIADLKLSSSVRDGVNIRIPKFKFDYDLKLKDDLIKLGINEVFSPMANLTKIANPDNPNLKLKVTDALHKADIDFTEKGVRAAAVTVIVVGGAMAAAPNPYVPKPIDIFIDKPFMFIVREKITNDIWFTGTVYEPNSWENEKDSYKKEN